MRQREVEGRVAAHRQADDMRPIDPVVPEDGDKVADRQRLAVPERVRWDVGRRIAARVEREASMPTGERLHLGFPVAQVARELVDEHHGRPGAGGYRGEPDATCVGIADVGWRGHDRRSPGGARDRASLGLASI